jgi:hypothetical protein
MLAQNWTKPLVNVALLMIAGASAVCCARAQQALSNGAIAGTLTDIRSAPLENMTVTLRNALTAPSFFPEGESDISDPSAGIIAIDRSFFRCSEFACDFTEERGKMEVTPNTACVRKCDMRQCGTLWEREAGFGRLGRRRRSSRSGRVAAGWRRLKLLI